MLRKGAVTQEKWQFRSDLEPRFSEEEFEVFMKEEVKARMDKKKWADAHSKATPKVRGQKAEKGKSKEEKGEEPEDEENDDDDEGMRGKSKRGGTGRRRPPQEKPRPREEYLEARSRMAKKLLNHKSTFELVVQLFALTYSTYIAKTIMMQSLQLFTHSKLKTLFSACSRTVGDRLGAVFEVDVPLWELIIAYITYMATSIMMQSHNYPLHSFMLSFHAINHTLGPNAYPCPDVQDSHQPTQHDSANTSHLALHACPTAILKFLNHALDNDLPNPGIGFGEHFCGSWAALPRRSHQTHEPCITIYQNITQRRKSFVEIRIEWQGRC